MLEIDPHPLLDLRAFVTRFPQPIKEQPSPVEIVSMLDLNAEAPMHSDDQVRLEVRNLFRHGGFKPTGRSKPASEYLRGAIEKGNLSSINVAVDVCNVVSLHSGLPISLVDADLVKPPLRVEIAPEGSSYVFNASGQEMDLSNLLCMFDAEGPSANGVKDSQRTKTGPETVRTLTLIWGTLALPGRATQAEIWYRELLTQLGLQTENTL